VLFAVGALLLLLSFFPFFLLETFSAREAGAKGKRTDFFTSQFSIMELTARLTADAVMATAKGGAQVLNFNVVDNDSYKPKGASKYKKLSTFFACSYWQGGKVQSVLRKGAIVTLQGRVGSKAYLKNNGEPASELTFHVNGFKVVQFAKIQEQQGKPRPEFKITAEEAEFTDVIAGRKKALSTDSSEDDDLPF